MVTSSATAAMMMSHEYQNASARPIVRGGQRQRERPVAGRAEEPQLAGAVGDLGVLAVLGAGVDAARDEPEEAADQAGQAAGQHQGRRPDGLLGPEAVDHGGRHAEERDDAKDERLDLHGRASSFVETIRFGTVRMLSHRRTARVALLFCSESNGWVAVACPGWPIFSSASEVDMPGLAGLEVGVVVVAGHRADLEVHERVVGAAQLGAAADVGALLVDGHLEDVVPAVLVARDHVELEQELRHPEGVDDVGRGRPRSGSSGRSGSTRIGISAARRRRC